METFALTVQRMPGGGYLAWCLINGHVVGDSEQTAPPLPHAARSTLHEIVQMTAIPMIEKHFQERAFIYQTALPPIDDGGINLPNGVRPDHHHRNGSSEHGSGHGNGHGSGLMDRLRSALAIVLPTLPTTWLLLPLIALASST